jgi:hypothetical protein
MAAAGKVCNASSEGRLARRIPGAGARSAHRRRSTLCRLATETRARSRLLEPGKHSRRRPAWRPMALSLTRPVTALTLTSILTQV